MQKNTPNQQTNKVEMKTKKNKRDQLTDENEEIPATKKKQSTTAAAAVTKGRAKQ